MSQSASEFGSGGRENERAEVASATKPRLGGERVLSSAASRSAGGAGGADGRRRITAVYDALDEHALPRARLAAWDGRIVA